ncbi:hypothetical protein [Novosphingobium kaempferiae]|uniref:hypothetical protein n=1 Tax=Novosphingobium kaempferiae TaxID=2896849 RepID=UPI001E2C8054|nr:hypothetical protein [Novosphingobium kaempferiae]
MAVRSVKIGRCSAALLLALSPLQSAVAQSSPSASVPAQSEAMSPAGEYVHSEMELVAGIRLNEDGTFEYGLTVGSLDERAKGRWVQAGGHIELTSDPRPVAPTITAGRVDVAPGEPFAFRVVAPNGADVPGVDFRIDFDSGESLQDYTNGSAWQLPADETRVPRFVTFAMPGYRLRSERLPLDARAGTVATFDLIPNDFGVADLTGVVADISTDGLTLHRPEGTMRFRRSSVAPD